MAERHADYSRVPVARTRGAIEDLLRQWGAAGLQWTDDYDVGRVTVRFRWPWEGTELQARISMVRPTDDEIRAEYARPPSADQVARRADQRWRTRHRQLLLLLRAQLNAVEAGITTAVEVFLPYLENAAGETVAELVTPQLQALPDSRGPLHVLDVDAS